MNYRIIKDLFYNRIIEKIENGTFIEGNKCQLQQYYFENKSIENFPISERTPEVCSSLMHYNKCRFSDVPESSRTREFFIDSFINEDVFDYIKKHITDFDRQFFKDLITTNQYATILDRNCFAIMPLEYIDEEMCSLAIIHSLEWSNDCWFYSVAKRKPEALTSDLWKLGARLYARKSGKENKFLDVTPEKYKDKEYFIEMCSCNFNCDCKLDTNKGKIMDTIPQEVITVEFLVDLLESSIDNVARFNERALETEIPHTVDGKVIFEKIWQFAVRLKGNIIRNIELNDERVEFFLSHYDKDSHEYIWAFKDKYKRYKKKKNDAEALAKVDERTQNFYRNTANLPLFHAFTNSLNGKNLDDAIDDITKINQTTPVKCSLLPIKFSGCIPQEFSKTLDSEEYLEMMYKELGVQIIEEFDDLFYSVSLPDGWTTDSNGYWTYVKDNDGNTIIEYFYGSNFYDRDAYVKTINKSKDKSLVRI